MENNSYDFYTYGMRTATDMYANSKKIADNIEEKYGKDARLEFECGISIELNKESFKNIEEFVLNFKDEAMGSNIITADNLRNNSYFDTVGISEKYDEEGNYIDPRTK